MDERKKYLERVREGTDAVNSLLEGGSNVPLEQYIDKVSVLALSDSLSLDPESWRTEDLEKILIIRDGLYELRHRLRDAGDEAEHSIDRILGALDRLYADLERALRSFVPEEFASAKNALASYQRSQHIETKYVSNAAAEIHEQTNEVLTQTHIVNRSIEINLIKIGDVRIESFKKVSLNIKRLSATVFAIKLSLEQNVVYQGMFNFLNENADRIVTELKEFVTSIKEVYEKTADLIADITRLAEIGERFTKKVGEFLRNIFQDDGKYLEESVDFKTINVSQGEVITCGAVTSRSLVTLGGRNGNVFLVDTSAGRMVSHRKLLSSDIYSVIGAGSDLVAFGTEDGLDVVADIGRNGAKYRRSYNEKMVSVAAPPWGKRGINIVTGSREGFVRGWSLKDGLTQHREGGTGVALAKKVGRNVQKLLVFNEYLLVATGDDILQLDSDLEVKKRIPIQFQITDMCFIDDESLVTCGDGKVSHVNLESGAYSRMIGASAAVKYSAIAKLNDKTICVATDSGRLCALNLNSGEEVGSIELDMQIRGILPFPRRLLAYGGAWNSPRSRVLAFVGWELTISGGN